MGGTLSSAIGSSSVTREQLLRSSQKPRDFMNQLFNTMISKLTPEDFLKLGRAQTCSSFVFMMADSLHKMFDDLRIRPMKGKDTGVVYFAKVDSLRAQTKDSRELCLIIAYFFIRLFQIFGALAITITDDPGAGAVLGATRYAAPVQPVQRGLFGQPKRLPGSRGTYLGVGGAQAKYFLAGKARIFAPIREVFDEGRIETTARGTPRLILAFRDLPEVELIPERTDETGRKDQNLRIGLGDSAHLYANMTLTTANAIAGTKRYRITMGNFRLVDISKRTVLGYINNQISAYKESFDITSLDGGQTWISGNIPFTDKITEIIQHVQEIYNEIELNPGATLKDLKAITKRQKEALGLEGVRGGLDAVGAFGRDKLGAVGAVGRDTGVPPALQNEYLLQTLKGIAGQKSVGFCVGRALQLLDANSLFKLRSGTGATSSVCVARFDALPQAVPQSGQTLDKMPGLKALDQLYHTRPSITQDDKVRVAVAGDASGEYAEFLKEMTSLFGRSGQTQLTGIEKIVVKDPNCGGAIAKKYLQLQDPKQIQGVLAIVNQMFGRQLAHTNAVIKFFNTRLFMIKKRPDGAPYIDIHPKILQGGIDELENVSKEARDILVRYYKGCEEQYQKGMELVLRARTVPIG